MRAVRGEKSFGFAQQVHDLTIDDSDSDGVEIIESKSTPRPKKSTRRESKRSTSPLPELSPTPKRRRQSYSLVDTNSFEKLCSALESKRSCKKPPPQTKRQASPKRQSRGPEMASRTKSTTATILVGEAETPFEVPNETIEKHQYLFNNLSYDDTRGPFIKTDALGAIDPASTFSHVVEYLRDGDYEPRLVNKNGISKLSGLAIATVDENAEILRHGLIYGIASDMHLEGLQELVRIKIQMLHPFSAHGLLLLVKIIFRLRPDGSVVDGLGREYLQGQMVDNYYALMAEEPTTLSRTLRNSAGLAKGVYMALAEDPENAGREGLDADD